VEKSLIVDHVDKVYKIKELADQEYVVTSVTFVPPQYRMELVLQCLRSGSTYIVKRTHFHIHKYWTLKR
jgi:succinyl-CoA synthetase alpha subunit